MSLRYLDDYDYEINVKFQLEIDGLFGSIMPFVFNKLLLIYFAGTGFVTVCQSWLNFDIVQ